MVEAPIALHGGGEAMPGDERVARTLLELAAVPALERSRACLPGTAGDPAARRVVILPTAAARGRPDLVAASVGRFLREVAAEDDILIRVDVAGVVDRLSAEEGAVAGLIASADLVVLPGGDPDLISAILRDTLAWRAILAARARGAAVWGAGAGAMALGAWCPTPDGGVPGLGLVPGLVVVPHFRAETSVDRLRAQAPAGLGVLGLAERTALVGSERDWRCVGEGTATWFPPGASQPAIGVRDGEPLKLPG